jgi:hypothetical protein
MLVGAFLELDATYPGMPTGLQEPPQNEMDESARTQLSTGPPQINPSIVASISQLEPSVPLSLLGVLLVLFGLLLGHSGLTV